MIEKNKKKVEEFYNNCKGAIINAKWSEGMIGCSQVEEYESEEKTFEFLSHNFYEYMKAVEAGFDNVQVAAFFGSVSYLYPLAFGCKFHYQGDLTISLPVYSEENPPIIENPTQKGLYPILWERIEKFQKIYPEIPISISDNQTPIDVITELIKPDDAIMLFYDNPELCHEILQKCTDSIIEINREFEKRINNFAGFKGNAYMPSGVHMCDDNASFLSPDIYKEFAIPYVNQISNEFGGINFHCCMKFEQNLKNQASVNGFRGFDAMPYYNDPKLILDALGENKIWQIYNYDWTIPMGETEKHIDFYKRIIDMTENRVALYIDVFDNKKEDAFKLAYEVKNYCIKKGLLSN